MDGRAILEQPAQPAVSLDDIDDVSIARKAREEFVKACIGIEDVPSLERIAKSNGADHPFLLRTCPVQGIAIDGISGHPEDRRLDHETEPVAFLVGGRRGQELGKLPAVSGTLTDDPLLRQSNHRRAYDVAVGFQQPLQRGLAEWGAELPGERLLEKRGVGGPDSLGLVERAGIGGIDRRPDLGCIGFQEIAAVGFVAYEPLLDQQIEGPADGRPRDAELVCQAALSERRACLQPRTARVPENLCRQALLEARRHIALCPSSIAQATARKPLYGVFCICSMKVLLGGKMYGRIKPGHGRRLRYYDWGATPFYALKVEPRLSYCLYVPRDWDEDGSERLDLVVMVHGSERAAQSYRDSMVEWAEANRAIVLAPLFPCNLAGEGDTEGYKLLMQEGLRYDEALLAMVSEVAERYRLNEPRFALHGFSGGGHFSHRFLYLHPDRLTACSIGAPGVVTLPEPDRPWPAGWGGMEERFGSRPDAAAIARVPIQCVIGADDNAEWEIVVSEGDPHWAPGINDAGATRLARIDRLADGLRTIGCKVRIDRVPAAAHDGWAMLPAVRGFLSDVLAKAAA